MEILKVKHACNTPNSLSTLAEHHGTRGAWPIPRGKQTNWEPRLTAAAQDHIQVFYWVPLAWGEIKIQSVFSTECVSRFHHCEFKNGKVNHHKLVMMCVS